MTATHYQSSKGPMLISQMAISHALNAIAKMEREGIKEQDVYDALMAHVDAEPSEVAAPAPIGDNNPPEATSYEIVKEKLDDLKIAASAWLDGTEIKTAQESAAVTDLLDKVRNAASEAEAARVAEKKPHDDAANAVQAKFNTLIGNNKTVTGIAVVLEQALRKATEGWLKKQKTIQDAEAAKLAAEAQKATDDARAAWEASQSSTDLEMREEALAKIDDARQAAFDLKKANAAKPQVNIGGRNAGLKTVKVPEIADLTLALRHYYADRPDDFKELVMKFAKDDLRANKPAAPGIIIKEDLVF